MYFAQVPNMLMPLGVGKIPQHAAVADANGEPS